MNLREDYARLRRLRIIAAEQPLPSDRIAALIQPFIDKYKNLRLARKSTLAPPRASPAPHPQHVAITSAILSLGLSLRRACIRGLAFHNSFQHAVADLAQAFSYRGFVECPASYNSDVSSSVPADEPSEIEGRMDVVWAGGERRRTPTVLFELDSTVKRPSLQKLLLAEAPHKFWIYFGPDLWTFKTSLAQWDPHREITPIIIPTKFAPTAL